MNRTIEEAFARAKDLPPDKVGFAISTINRHLDVLALIFETEAGLEQATALMQAVYAHWVTLPQDQRPRLYMHGDPPQIIVVFILHADTEVSGNHCGTQLTPAMADVRLGSADGSVEISVVGTHRPPSRLLQCVVVDRLVQLLAQGSK